MVMGACASWQPPTPDSLRGGLTREPAPLYFADAPTKEKSEVPRPRPFWTKTTERT
jgi:hypothetical protein